MPTKADHKQHQRPTEASARAWEALTPLLAKWILEAVHSLGFERMTPVQASTIPLFTGHKDPVVEAVTGSGKTLAFLIPIIERLLKLDEPIPKHHVGAIIISPTRELATQIHSVLLQLLAFHPPSAAALPITGADDVASSDQDPPRKASASSLKVVPQLLTGGSSSTPQATVASFLRTSPNLLIATPGRLLDLLSSPHVHCPQSSFQVLVLDEADRLLHLGFKPTLNAILARLPKQRRTGLFSASVSEAVEELVRVGLRNPYRVNVKVRSLTGESELRTPAALQLRYLTVDADRKIPTLLRLISRIEPQPLKTIAYLPTCAAVDYLAHLLPAIVRTFWQESKSESAAQSPALQVVPLHGKLSQKHREKNLESFTNSASSSLLLTTDVAARGLDIPSVDLVVQLDPPSDPSAFLHRSGRAGRAGRKGLAVVFLMPGRETDEYPSYLGVRRTPVEQLAIDDIVATNEEAAASTQKLRDVVRKDRALHDKSQVALPSYVQAYRKHTARSIFRVLELPFKDIAIGWGMLKLPRMPELKGVDVDHSLGLNIDWSTYAYRDKAREKRRKAEAAEIQEMQGGAHRKDINGMKRTSEQAWSRKKDAQELRDARREKRVKKRDKEKEVSMTAAEKMENAELQSLIAQVRASNTVSHPRSGVDGDGDAFEGFD